MKRPVVDGLLFDPVSHSFFWKGVRVPSVTQVLRDVNITHPYRNAEGAAARGKAAHEWMAEVVTEKLPISKVPEAHRGYCNAEAAFLKKLGATSCMAEVEVFHSLYMYAGIADRIVKTRTGLFVVEYKTGRPEDWHYIQLGGYTMALRRMGVKIGGGLVCYVKDDGTFACPDTGAGEASWQCAVHTYRCGYRNQIKTRTITPTEL